MTTAEVLLIKEDVLTIYTEGDEESKARVIELPEEVFLALGKPKKVEFRVMKDNVGQLITLQAAQRGESARSD